MSPTRSHLVSLALLVVLGPQAAAARATQTPLTTQPAASVDLEHVRAAVRARQAPPAGLATLVGACSYKDLPHAFRFTFDAAGRFLFEREGRLGSKTGWDGTTLWNLDVAAGVPYAIELYGRDAEIASRAAWSGAWTRDDFPFELADEVVAVDGTWRVRMTSPRTTWDAVLIVDAQQHVVTELVTTNWTGTLRWTFGAFGADGFARTLSVFGASGNENTYKVDALEQSKLTGRPFERPPLAPTNVRFDSEVEPALEVSRAPSGHLLVRATVNGRDVGPFVFDTGAGSSTITPQAAAALGLEVFGQGEISGGGTGSTTTTLRQANELRLGPLVLERPVFTEFASVGLGEAGILGWDVLIQAVVEVDMQATAIALFPPRDYELDVGDWLDLVLHSRHPHVRASFEGEHEGLFRIDTGAGSIAVMFHTPTVDALDLLADRKTQASSAHGAGGTIAMEVGTIEWFEIAGNRVEHPPTVFCRDPRGALADPNSCGNLGGGVLKPFILAFDYQRSRVGFIPREWR